MSHRLYLWKIVCITTVLLATWVSLGGASTAQKLVVMNVGSLEGTVKSVAEFTAKTGIEVEVLITDWNSFDDKVLLMLTTGQQLDLIRCDTGHAARAALNGWLYPLSNLIKRDNLDLTFIPDRVLRYPPNEGEIFTLPYNFATSLLWYHRGHYQEAGVDYPPVTYGHPDLQWDNWIAMSKKLIRVGPDGQVTRWGTHMGVGLEGYYLLGVYNVDWVTPNVDRFLGATAEVVGAYNKIISVYMTEGAAPKPAERGSLNFLGGVNLASQIGQTGTWMINVDPQSVDLGISPMPWGSVVAVQGGINSWGITSTTKHVEAAWEFLKYFTFGDGMIAWMKYESKSPVMNRRYFNHWMEIVHGFMPNADLSVVLGAGNYFWNTRMTLSPGWTAIRPIFEGAIREAAAGTKSVAAVMEGVAGQIDAILKENPLYK